MLTQPIGALAAWLLLQVPLPPPPPFPPDAPPQPPVPIDQVREDFGQMLTPRALGLSPAEAAGHVEDANPYRLTLERAYALASARLEGGESAQAIRDALGDADRFAKAVHDAKLVPFDRYPGAFAAPGAGGVVDPGPLYLEAARRFGEAEAAYRVVGALGSTAQIYRAYAQGGASSGVGQSAVDRIELESTRARRQLDEALLAHRAALDQLKVALGLPADAPVVIDPEILGGYREAFWQIRAVESDPDRDPADLDRAIDTLPALPVVSLDGVELLPSAFPHDAELLRRVEPRRKGPGATDPAQAALERRADIRKLLVFRRRYDDDRLALRLATRLKAQRLQRMLAPPDAGGQGSSTADLAIDHLFSSREIAEVERAILADWAEFQRSRLALHRRLDTRPAGDWTSFLDSIAAPPPAEPRPDAEPGPGAPPPPAESP